MLRTLALGLLAVATLAGAKPALAEAKTFSFDKKHTQILFFVDHMGFSKSSGKFLDFDGSFTYDEANPAAGSVNVTIQTASINMDDQAWDDHLKNKDFFDVENHPTMTFKSTKVEMNGEKTARLTGDLTLLGQTKPVTLDVTLNKCGEHPMSKKLTCGFNAMGTLKRSEWGMTYGLPMVGDEVQILITVEASAE